MINRRTAKFVSFLIIAFIIFQIIPGASTVVEGLKDHARNSKEILTPTPVNDGVFTIGRTSIKPSFHQTSSKYSPIVIDPAIFLESSPDSAFHENRFDRREAIKQSISHYFNGSKYKDVYLSI